MRPKFRAEMESLKWVYGEGPPFTATLRRNFTWEAGGIGFSKSKDFFSGTVFFFEKKCCLKLVLFCRLLLPSIFVDFSI